MRRPCRNGGSRSNKARSFDFNAGAHLAPQQSHRVCLSPAPRGPRPPYPYPTGPTASWIKAHPRPAGSVTWPPIRTPTLRAASGPARSRPGRTAGPPPLAAHSSQSVLRSCATLLVEPGLTPHHGLGRHQLVDQAPYSGTLPFVTHNRRMLDAVRAPLLDRRRRRTSVSSTMPHLVGLDVLSVAVTTGQPIAGADLDVSRTCRWHADLHRRTPRAKGPPRGRGERHDARSTPRHVFGHNHP